MVNIVWLIAEDETDAAIVRKIVVQKGFACRVEYLAMEGGSGGITRLANQLERLIQQGLTQIVKRPGDKIAVLVDAELHKSEKEQVHHEKISRICRGYTEYVILIWAVQEIESWLLADSGICKWLDRRQSAKNCDGLDDPKASFNRLLNKHKKPKMQGIGREKVLEHLAADGDKRSPSMGIAVAQLAELCSGKEFTT